MNEPFREMHTGPSGRHLPVGDVRGAEVSAQGIDVVFDRERITLNPDWLRDNCPCDQCRIRQTDERRWRPWLDPDAAVPETIDSSDGALIVRWRGGHESRFAASDFAVIDRAMRRGSWTTRLWRADYTIERFEHDTVVADVPTRRRFFETFRRDGAAVITGSPCVPGTVLDFLRSIGITVRDSSLGLIFDVKLDPAGYNVAFTAENVPPHNDNAQYAHPPSGQVLAMLVNDATGGETVVVDGWSVLDDLRAVDPAALDVLARVEVGFRQYSSEVEAFTRAPLVVRDRAGRFSHLRFSNQLMQPLAIDDSDLGEWYRAYRLLGRAVSDPSNHVSFRLNAGDMLFVNGYRVLHARTEFTPDGPRHLQDVYFDVDDVLGNLARMTGEATDAMVSSVTNP